MDDVRDDYISRKQLYDYVKHLMNIHNTTVNEYTRTGSLVRVLEFISVIPGKEKYNDTFAFDFSNVKRFNCQCGRHYVNTSYVSEKRLNECAN